MSSDLRVIKTHRSIREALINLLHEQSFEKISVQDILDKALVNRSTFYKYYSGKSDLAGKMIADFKDSYAQALQIRFSGISTEQFIDQVAPPFLVQRRLILALWSINTRKHHLYADMHAMIKTNFINYAQSRDSKQTDWDFQATIFATMALTTARYFFENERIIPFSELIKQLSQMMDLVSLSSTSK